MSLCAVCGAQLATAVSLCPHHLSGFDEHWAMTNRIMCDLLHRGIVVARLPVADRDPPSDGAAEERPEAPLEMVAA